MAEDKTTSPSDAAATVRSRRASTPRASSTQATPVKPTAALATVDGDGGEKSRPLEVTGHAPSPAHTLVGTFVAGHITSSDYVAARADGYYAWYPDGCLQPSCQRVWLAGQLVLREVYERYGGDDTAATPRDAIPANEPGGAIAVPHTPGVYVTP